METKVLFEFGEFRFDPAEHLLLRDRKPVSLTPKAFDILQILLQSNGRLLSKEELMNRIWPNSFVEEANLTVNISALRKVLGDPPDGGEYIETVPKRGYRFVAEVTELLEEGETAKPKAQTVLRPQHQPGESVKALEAVQVVPALPIVPAPASPRRPTRSRKVATAILIVVVLAIAGIGVLIYRQHMTRSPAAASRRLAILPFQNLRQDPDSDFLGYSLADAVITKLGYLSALSVRPSATIQKYRNQVIDIHKVATELNVDTLLSGSFIREGDDLRITYQLIDAKTEKIIGRGAIDLKYEKLLKVQDSVSQEIIGALELNLSPSEAERIRTDVPVNPVAYEYYLRGVDLYGRHNFPLAIKMLEISQHQAQQFYAVHASRPFYNSLTEFMSSGSIVAIALEKENAIADLRKLMGATNPANAEEGTIRKKWASSIEHNAIHGSDAEDTARFELSFFFAGYELAQ